MNVRQLFPLGKAYGKAFCNRVEETKKLVGNIQNCKHTLLIAPRRYGKSSLAERGIEETGYPFVRVNFHLATSEEEITQLILDGVVKLIGLSIGQIEKIITSIKKYITNLEPLLSFGHEVVSLKLISKSGVNNSVVISEALLLVERLLKEKRKKAVIFFDEFQEINSIGESKNIEGAVRTAAQETQSLSIIFSGSIRSLLASMFEDEKRPLYKLCRKIKLDRISVLDYEKHIQKIALATWGSYLKEETFNRIMDLSNRHPYYVNYLCDCVWEQFKNLPEIKDIESAWLEVVKEEWSDALKELSDLPLGQRKVLKLLATSKIKNVQNYDTSSKLAMATSSIASAVTSLIDKDYVEQDLDGFYKVINPLLFAVLNGVEI